MCSRSFFLVRCVPWMMRPLDDVSLGLCGPVWPIPLLKRGPMLNSDLLGRDCRGRRPDIFDEFPCRVHGVKLGFLWVTRKAPGETPRFFGAMLVHPRSMCPRPKILGFCIPWTKCPLANLPLIEPSHPFDWIERSDTRLPTAARFSAAKRWSSMCGSSVHPTEGRESNKLGQGRRRSRPDAPLIH